jgi:hypothetical protein
MLEAVLAVLFLLITVDFHVFGSVTKIVLSLAPEQMMRHQEKGLS